MVIQNEELICALNTNKKTKLVTFMILSKSLIAIIYKYILLLFFQKI